MSVVFNEIRWATDHLVVSATFIDESGDGLHHVLVRGNSGAALLPRIDLDDCPQVFTTPEFRVPLTENPVLGEASTCADAASDGEPDYALRVPHEFVRTLPVDGEPSPCSIPLDIREDAGTPCAAGRDAVAAIADEIDYLCGSVQLARYSLENWERQVRNWAIGLVFLVILAATTAVAASQTPFPGNVILGVVVALMLIAMAVCAYFLYMSVRERDLAREALEHAEWQLEDARERYRRAVEDAIRACCGLVPTGVSIDPPPCPPI